MCSDILSNEEIIRLRKEYVSPSLSVHYSRYKPLHIVKGEGLYLIDETGQRYLDCINNVAVVGHSHPRLVQALTQQMTAPDLQLLEDGTTIASEELRKRYVKKILGTLPEGAFDTILFTESGSTANDLALSIAEAVTGHTQIISLDGAYHGHSKATMGLSTYKLRQSKTDSFKLSPTTVVEEKPDVFQGQYKDPTTAGILYANDMKTRIANEISEGRQIAAFISEPFLGTAGQVPLPEGYLSAVYRHVREAGGLCIADEVQTGFARAGTAFWMHQIHGVIPDMLIMGKPMANGHPVSAVVTKLGLAQKFFEKNGEHLIYEFLPDPLSLALAETVYDIIVSEGLQENAHVMGEYILRHLGNLKSKYSCIGDVRGTGLFIGMEIIKNINGVPQSDRDMAELLVKKALIDHNVLIKEDGTEHNVIKIKPPICFTEQHAIQLIQAIDKSLADIYSSSSN